MKITVPTTSTSLYDIIATHANDEEKSSMKKAISKWYNTAIIRNRGSVSINISVVNDADINSEEIVAWWFMTDVRILDTRDIKLSSQTSVNSDIILTLN